MKNSRLDSLALPPLPLLQTLDLRDNKVNLRVSVVFLSSCVEMEVGLGYLAEMGRGQYPGIGTNLSLSAAALQEHILDMFSLSYLIYKGKVFVDNDY